MKKGLKVWFGAFNRGLIVGGLTLFSLAISQGFCWTSFESAAIAGGGYMFLELAKFYGIPQKKTKSKNKYNFILLP